MLLESILEANQTLFVGFIKKASTLPTTGSTKEECTETMCFSGTDVGALVFCG